MELARIYRNIEDEALISFVLMLQYIACTNIFVSTMVQKHFFDAAILQVVHTQLLASHLLFGV